MSAIDAGPRKLPIHSARDFVILLLGGVAATIAFDLFGQWLTPTLGFARLAPEPLAAQTLGTVFGEIDPGTRATLAAVMHWFTGIVIYSIGYAFVAMPIARAIIPSISWVVVAVAYGVVLWVFALYIMAHLVNGNPPFLGFTGITWVALIGHVLFALVLGALVPKR